MSNPGCSVKEPQTSSGLTSPYKAGMFGAMGYLLSKLVEVLSNKGVVVQNSDKALDASPLWEKLIAAKIPIEVSLAINDDRGI